MYDCKYFRINELVSPIVYEHFGEFAWKFFDEDILKELDFIREEWGSSIIINNWSWGGQYKESGLRCNKDIIVKNKNKPYLSGHVLAKAFDLKPSNKSYLEFYAFIWKLLDTSDKIKRFKRIEAFEYTATWVHIDALRTIHNKCEIFSL